MFTKFIEAPLKNIRILGADPTSNEVIEYFEKKQIALSKVQKRIRAVENVKKTIAYTTFIVAGTAVVLVVTSPLKNK